MKTLRLLIIPFCLTLSSFFQVSKYEQAMLTQIEKIYQVREVADYQPTINVFERIAATETDKWEPRYYAGYGYAMLAARTEEVSDKDKYLDLAMGQITKGMTIAEGESELVALEGFVHMIRLSVDPASRGQKYAGLSMASFGKALAMNPDNPRAAYLQANMKVGTAKFFGGDTSEACGELKASVEKFDSYKSENPLAPSWGKGQATNAAKQCN